MVDVGLEPTPPNKVELESSALDHPTIQPGNVQRGVFWSAAPWQGGRQEGDEQR